MKLPDFYETAARDAAGPVGETRGLWADLGCGAGGVGLALARQSESRVLLVDPNPDALGEAMRDALARFAEERSPDTFHRLAVTAGLSRYEIVSDTASIASEAGKGLAIWLRFKKEAEHGT